jgi:hypothetical protein
MGNSFGNLSECATEYVVICMDWSPAFYVLMSGRSFSLFPSTDSLQKSVELGKASLLIGGCEPYQFYPLFLLSTAFAPFAFSFSSRWITESLYGKLQCTMMVMAVLSLMSELCTAAALSFTSCDTPNLEMEVIAFTKTSSDIAWRRVYPVWCRFDYRQCNSELSPNDTFKAQLHKKEKLEKRKQLKTDHLHTITNENEQPMKGEESRP